MEKKTNSLLARLNSYESFSAATPDGKKYGQGIYMDFSEESEFYKDKTFKELIEAMVEQALASEVQEYKEIADCAKMLITYKIPQANLEIRTYDPKSDSFIVNDDNGMSLSLDDKVKNYVTEKDVSIDGKTRKVDYLDIILTLVFWD